MNNKSMLITSKLQKASLNLGSFIPVTHGLCKIQGIKVRFMVKSWKQAYCCTKMIHNVTV